ncbi:MAG: UDP-N-acetylmuramoyl-L-alanyl-D-glutamate--2,6-diaminopimelate ligase, partial [Microbacteriaceae bacterium]|nr:UDP-N-acetylmuramoyl-L-alanyl-D-glutamate--2,6-diaminopimelate ligase [Microbacteriaceae bacterium]
MPEPTIRPHHPSARELSVLVDAFGLDADGLELDQVEVTGVSSASWRVEAGDLFVAMPGRAQHGAEHAEAAVERGAVAIVSDAEGAARIGDLGVPVLVVDEPRLALGHLAEWIYRTDGDDSRLIGVTGTRGKTSVVRLVDALLRALGDGTAISTSIERRVGDELVPAGLTSPEADQLHAMVARMRELGVRVGSIEVTAHGIAEHRLAGLELDVVGMSGFDPER